MRCGWVNTSNPSFRATATSVMPAASAMRTASAVGAETATMMARADGGGFLHHLDRHAARQQHHALLCRRALAGKRTGKLVERVVAPDVLAHGDKTALGIEEAGAMHGACLAVQLLQGKQLSLSPS